MKNMGEIETAVRDLLAASMVPCYSTSELCERIYGHTNKSKRVSMLRVMRRIAERDPAMELGQMRIHQRDSLGRSTAPAEVALYDATNIDAVSLAHTDDVDLDAPQDGGNLATFVHRRALMLARGEDTTAFEATRYAARAERVKAEERAAHAAVTERLANAAQAAMLRLMLHVGSRELGLHLGITGEGAEAQMQVAWDGLPEAPVGREETPTEEPRAAA
jgi:hypothetical protein